MPETIQNMSTDGILRFGEGVTLLGGGPVGEDDMAFALDRAPRLLAADGGADHALASGRMPERVIGDMDSLSAAGRDRLAPEILYPVAEQDSTDFEKCLARIEAPLILGLGFLGGRGDHALAALNALVRHGGARLLVGAEDVVFAIAGPTEIAVPAGTRVSLFPMRALRGRSRGLEWPIDGLDLAPDGRIGTSNRAVGTVRLEPEGAGLLVFLPRDCLDIAIAALRTDDAGSRTLCDGPAEP